MKYLGALFITVPLVAAGVTLYQLIQPLFWVIVGCLSCLIGISIVERYDDEA